MNFTFLIFVFFAVFSLNAFSATKASCVESFDKSVAKTDRQKNPNKDYQNIFETETFADKKYSLSFMKRAGKALSIRYIMNEYPVIESKDQLELAKFYEKNKDDRSFSILYFSNFRLVAAIASRFTYKNKDSFDDYFQEGLLGLADAIQKFDSVKFKGTMAAYMGRWSTFRMMDYKNRRSRIVKNAPLQLDNEPIDNEPEIFNYIKSKENLEKNITDKLYIEEIYQWVWNQISQMENKKRWQVIFKQRVFTDEPVKAAEIANKFKVTNARVLQIESEIRKMIKDKFKFSPLEFER